MGVYNDSGAVSCVEYSDLEEGQQWRPLPSVKTARHCIVAAFYSLEYHKIVVAGGWDGGKGLNTVEEPPVLFRGASKDPTVARRDENNIMTGCGVPREHQRTRRGTDPRE